MKDTGKTDRENNEGQSLAIVSKPEWMQALDSLALSEGHHAVVLQVRSVIEPILHFLPRSIPNFTDHGVIHSNNLFKLLANYIEKYSEYNFTEEEKYLISLAICLHDIGCINGRTDHHIKSARLILKHPSLTLLKQMIGEDILNCLALIIKAHSTRFDLKKIPKSSYHHHIRHRLLCAFFRLLDGCEITNARTSSTLYEILVSYKKIRPSSMPHWESHLSIKSLVFEKNTIIIYCDNLAKARFQTQHLKNDLKKLNLIFKKENFPVLKIKVNKLRL